MASRKILKVAGALALLALGGCAAYPYNDPYAYNQYPDRYAERDGYYGPNYYPAYPAPGYYVGPTVGFGITYGGGYYRHRHYR